MNNFDHRAKREHEQLDNTMFSVPIKAGKRIYYMDVKETRGHELYITLSENRKKQARDGEFVIDKQKIHIYKEDLTKFAGSFSEVLNYVKSSRPEYFESQDEHFEFHASESTLLVSPVEIQHRVPTEDEFFKDI